MSLPANRPPWRLAAAIFALAACASGPPRARDGAPDGDEAGAADFVTDAAARIDRIIDAETVVIARGKRDGLVTPSPGNGMIVSPRPEPTEARKTPTVRFGVRSAVATVVSIGEHETTLRLERIAAPIHVGDYVSWQARAPAALHDDPLARCAYLDVGMRTLDGVELVTLHTLVAGGAAASRAAVDAMVDEVHAQAELAKQVHTVPADGGRFVGLDVSAAFAKTNREDVLAFVDFVATYPGKYLTWQWKFVEIYATWIINRAPPGDSMHLKNQLDPLERDGARAVATRDWTAAASAWRSVLAIEPGHARAKAQLAAIDALTQAETLLAHDPESRAAAWKRAKALGDLGLDEDAVAAWGELIASGYRTRDATKERTWRLAALARWPEVARALDALIAAQDEPALRLWRDYVTAQRQLAEATGGASAGEAQAEAHLELGRIREAEKSWEAAATDYRQALDAAPSTELRERAKAGQLRASRRAELDQLEATVLTSIAGHHASRAREQVAALLDECSALELPDVAADALARFAEGADAVDEHTVEDEWLTTLVAMRPNDAAAWTRRAWFDISQGQWDAAEAALERAKVLAPLDTWARRSRAWLLVARGRYADGKAVAMLASNSDADLAFTMLRAAVGLGDLKMAAGYAAKAAELDPARFGEVERGVEALRRVAGMGDAKSALTRVRALVKLSLPTLALAEARRITDAGRRRDAGWTIALAAAMLAPGDWALEAARLDGGSTPERKRVLDELEARRRLVEEGATSATRRTYAEALIARGRFDKAIAIVAGGADEVHSGTVDPALQDVRARALRGLDAVDNASRAGEAAARGDHEHAAELYARARDAFTVIDAPQLAIATSVDELRALVAAGRRDQARALGARWLGPAKQDGGPFYALDIEVNLAGIGVTDLDALEALYARHLATCLAEEREHCEAVVRLLRSDLAYDRGRAAEAVSEAEVARRLWLGLHDAKDARAAALKLASLRRQRGELAEAMQLSEATYRDASQAGDGESERAALLELGTTALRIGDGEAARRWLTAARASAERNDDAMTRASTAYWLGRVALDLDGDTTTAKAELERARRMFEARGDDVEVIAVTALLARADPAHALALTTPLLPRTRPLGRQVLLAEVLVAHARALLLARRIDEARAVSDEALGVIASVDLPDLRARAFQVAGDVAQAAHATDQATDHYVAAARAVAETLTRTGAGLPLGADTRKVIDAAIGALYKAGRTAEAIEIVELQRVAQAGRLIDLGHIQTGDRDLSADLAALGKARAENELARARRHVEAEKPLSEQSPTTQRELAQVTARTDQEVAALLMKLQRDHRALFGALAVSPLALVQQRATLPPHVLVVDYFIADDALYAFVVRKEDPEPRAFRIEVPRDRLTQTIARHRTLLGQDGRLAEAVARDLYAWLLAPIESLVPESDRDATTLVVIAEGALQYVPFGALVTSARGEPTRYALERWRIASALSTTIFRLFEPAAKHATKTSVLAFLDPTNELPGAKDELAGIPNVTAYAGAQATWDVFLRESPRHPILHFATHGKLSTDAFENGLALADRTLTIDRINGFTGLRNKTRLVVLSACQTATELGDVADRPDDEAISMARSFAVAGVPSIVASLWDVDDRATRELMQAFYATLAEPRRDTLAALREAQLSLLHTPASADPRYWAAFQLIGDWR